MAHFHSMLGLSFVLNLWSVLATATSHRLLSDGLIKHVNHIQLGDGKFVLYSYPTLLRPLTKVSWSSLIGQIHDSTFGRRS